MNMRHIFTEHFLLTYILLMVSSHFLICKYKYWIWQTWVFGSQIINFAIICPDSINKNIEDVENNLINAA